MPRLVSLVLAGMAVLLLFGAKKALELILTNEYVGWARLLARLLITLAGIICPPRAREWKAGLRYFQEQEKADPGLRMAASHLAWSPWHCFHYLWHHDFSRPKGQWAIRYLVPGERLIYVSRRHTVMLSNSFAFFVVSLVLGIASDVESHRWPAAYLGQVGIGIALLGIPFFSWRVVQWVLTRYVITGERIVLIEGLIARRVTALPLRSITDMTYRRTIAGRLFGYCNLEFRLSGHPELRSMTRLPNPDRIYALILRLLSEQLRPPGAHELPHPGGGSTS